MGGFPATILNQSSDLQLEPPRDVQDGVAFKFGSPDHLDSSLQEAKELEITDLKETKKAGELNKVSNMQLFSSPTEHDAS